MALTVPKHRVLLDDTNSVKDTLALGLMQLVEPANAVTWDLIPFGEPIRQLSYEVGSRPATAREVVLENNFLTGDTDIDINAATRARVTDGHVLYHPATKQRIILNEVNTSTGVCTFRSVQQASGGSRTQINAGQTLYVLSISEHYEQINAESRFEGTSKVNNYIQDLTERIEFSTADLREARKFGVDKARRLKERMSDIVKDLNLSVLYNSPVAASETNSAMTAGFDYLIEAAGSAVAAATSGTAKISDLKGVLKQLQKNGVGPDEGLVMLCSVNVYHAYLAEGLVEVDVSSDPGANFVLGNIITGLTVPGIGFVPFYVDPRINDDIVRFISTNHASKSFYQGTGEGAILESVRVIDEPSMSTSKVSVSTMQQKWGTDIRNTDTVHYLLTGTGLN